MAWGLSCRGPPLTKSYDCGLQNNNCWLELKSVKVLHVIPSVAARYGGPSQAIYQICVHLSSQGIVPIIATTNADGVGVLPVPLGKLEPYQNIPTIFFRRNVSESFKYSRSLAQWLDINVANFDLVHIHAVFSHSSISAARACRRHSVPYLVRTIGSLDPWGVRHKPFRKKIFWHLAVKQMLQGAAAIHYTSQTEQYLAESTLHLQRGVVIPLGVDEKLLQSISEQNPFFILYPNLRENPYVLTLCRLHPIKNLETLIKLFVGVTQQFDLKHWKLVIAGDGEPEYVERLRRQAALIGGEQRVLFVGWLHGEEKRGALLAANLFALLSHQENFGLSVVEAMACGVPVLISEGVNLADEVTTKRAGWVVPLAKQEIETTLHAALTDPNERVVRGQAARTLVLQQYTWPKVADELVKLYGKLTGRGTA